MNQHIAINDLEINEELDTVSLGSIVGGRHCGNPRQKVCKKVIISYFKKVRILAKKTVFYFKTVRVRAFKTALICYWR